jgi:tRNA A37 threonylcarbamoyladenosine dehydratase
VGGGGPTLGGDDSLKLDCGAGLGAATHVTGTFGFAMAGKAIEGLLKP